MGNAYQVKQDPKETAKPNILNHYAQFGQNLAHGQPGNINPLQLNLNHNNKSSKPFSNPRGFN